MTDLTQKIKDLVFNDVPIKAAFSPRQRLLTKGCSPKFSKIFSPTTFFSSLYEPGDSQQAHHAPWGSITVVDRMTGSGWRDIETGFRDPDGRFWLAAGNFDIRNFPDLSISEAIELIKARWHESCL